MTPLDRITERVNRLGDVNDPSTPRPMLTLGEFFDGNDIAGSIGCNLDPMPSPQQFHELLQRIASRPDVRGVRVEVTMFDGPDWPFSDTVWIFTAASPAEVASWFPEQLRPDDCHEGWADGVTYESFPVPSGTRPICCWWD